MYVRPVHCLLIQRRDHPLCSRREQVSYLYGSQWPEETGSFKDSRRLSAGKSDKVPVEGFGRRKGRKDRYAAPRRAGRREVPCFCRRRRPKGERMFLPTRSLLSLGGAFKSAHPPPFFSISLPFLPFHRSRRPRPTAAARAALPRARRRANQGLHALRTGNVFVNSLLMR